MRISALVLLAVTMVVTASPAGAEPVEVAPGIVVTRTQYAVAANEAPFFNFIAKTQEQRVNDENFVSGILAKIPDRTEAANEAISRGWKFVRQGDFASAAKRFNQAYLIDPTQSTMYHGFAIVVSERFGDVEYADELFRAAAHANAPSPILSRDHAFLVLDAGRPDDARQILEKGMRDFPDSFVPLVSFAILELTLGNLEDACKRIEQVPPEDAASVADVIALIREGGNC